MTRQARKDIQNEGLPALSQRDTEATIRQRRAADPSRSVWVGASAGTGKTKVLTDRVLRLLLPRPDGRPATPPGRILCLTFTRAAAAEMALRINERLAKWAVMSDSELEDDMSDLLGYRADQDLRKAARRLFGQVIDVPGGLKITNIHSFCQSILGRFPIEAGIAPNFEVIDEDIAKELMEIAKIKVIKRAAFKEEKNTDLHERSLESSFLRLSSQLTERSLDSALTSVNAERGQLLKAMSRYPDILSLKKGLAEIFNVPDDFDPNHGLRKFCKLEGALKEDFWTLCKALHDGTAKIRESAQNLQLWLEKPEEERLEHLTYLFNVFLTGKGLLRTTRGFPKDREDIAILYTQLGDKILSLKDHIKACKCAQNSLDLLVLGRQVHMDYEAEKSWRGGLDYDDMIRLTRDLLVDDRLHTQKASPSQWVLFKLDGGLDHILVDEAQDTNPEQWEIILKLCEDFFAGQSARGGPGEENLRSLFVVGDEKQSIYSFQRADPEAFHDMHALFAQKIEAAEMDFENIAMSTSFRSTDPVLRLVDTIFDTPEGRNILGLGNTEQSIAHKAHRSKDAGRIELWPLTKGAEKKDFEPWSLPVTIEDVQSAKSMLATDIAEQIRIWLDKKESLKSTGQAIRPGDIMILVRSRTDLVPSMIRELKICNIPVNGVDRMTLSREIIVEDLLTLADFALLPEDDLALATILKSPLIGWDDEQLFRIAYKRTGSLWQALRDSGAPNEHIVRYLEKMIARAAELRPYDFFAGIIHDNCPAEEQGSARRAFLTRLGVDALDPMDEFLSACITYETSEIPSLQSFVIWQRHHEKQIKRETEDGRDQVRIMTIHGAKGLQAPVVFLPDTTRTGHARHKDKILWPNRTKLPLPIFSARSENDCAFFVAQQDKLGAYQDKEYQRLLYVALTRAEDRLIICGAKPTNSKILDDSWYGSCEKAFEEIEGVREEKNLATGRKIRIYETEQRTPIDSKKTEPPQIDEKVFTPWLFKPAPKEPDPPRPLTPTRPSMPEQALASPRKGGDDDIRFQRGNLTHKLLEHLPDIPEDKRDKAARNFLEHATHDLSDKVLEDIRKETMAILNHPDYAEIFGPGSRAEVPVSGLLGRSSLVSGVIDRLLITPKRILIIDYKTNRPPPAKPQEVPEIYIQQLRGYRDILARIYPERKISCALIWTDGPNLMDLTEIL